MLMKAAYTSCLQFSSLHEWIINTNKLCLRPCERNFLFVLLLLLLIISLKLPDMIKNNLTGKKMFESM